MNAEPLRVALFTDTFHEVNGVALTCRQLDAFARRHNLPFFSFHAGPDDQSSQEGLVTTVQLRRRFPRLSMESDFSADLFFLRHRGQVREQLRKFRPDFIHVTSPGDCGVLGVALAHDLGIPMAASWHTNVHEFAAWRLRKMASFLPAGWRDALGSVTERKILDILVWYYSKARLILAPNPELIAMLESRTGRPVRLMRRGIDTGLFSPAKRTRTDDAFVIGFVGRVSAEKNVRLLAQLEETLLRSGHWNFRFLIIGQGGERSWLQSRMRHADFPGVLKGEALAEAYANMDAFVFTSLTDTYGNVINESLASAVPAVVTSGGGPKFLVEDGINGFVSKDDHHFFENVSKLLRDRELQRRMSAAARGQAERTTWDRVFQQLYQDYESVFDGGQAPPETIGVPARTISRRVAGLPVTSGALAGSPWGFDAAPVSRR